MPYFAPVPQSNPPIEKKIRYLNQLQSQWRRLEAMKAGTESFLEGWLEPEKEKKIIELGCACSEPHFDNSCSFYHGATRNQIAA